MQKKITISSRHSTKVLELGAPGLSGVLIDSIDGLSQESSTISTYKAVYSNKFSRSSRANRNIVFRLRPITTDPESIRDELNKVFPAGEKVTITIETTHKILSIIGYVENYTASIYSRAQLISISVICPDANFYSSETIVNIPGSTENYTIVYPGLIDTGLVVKGTVTAAISGVFSITVNDITVSIDTAKVETLIGSSIEIGDIFELSTIQGSKHFRHIRGEVEKNILSALDPMVWFSLSNGDNPIVLPVSHSIVFSISYTSIYGGV